MTLPNFGTATVARITPVRLPTCEAPRGPCRRSEPVEVEDDGTADVFAVVPVRTVNVTNAREHWATRQRRTKAEHDAVYAALLPHYGKRDRLRNGCRITITRIAPKEVGASNLHATLKGIIDAVAMFVLGGTSGQYDDDPRLEWKLEQRTAGRGVYGVTVAITCKE